MSQNKWLRPSYRPQNIKNQDQEMSENPRQASLESQKTLFFSVDQPDSDFKESKINLKAVSW